MTGRAVRVLPLGDAAVLLQVDGEDDETVEPLVRSLTAAAEALHRHDSRFGRPVPGFASVLVPVDPARPGLVRAVSRLSALADGAQPIELQPDHATLVALPVRYGGADGPDLAEVAELNALTPDQVVEAHASTEYRVRFLGFAPGFAYLWRLPAVIATPRLDTPRQRVPAGSVAIAGEMTAVYPGVSPGGWRLIGRALSPVWNPARPEPAVLRPGMRVRFVPER